MTHVAPGATCVSCGEPFAATTPFEPGQVMTAGDVGLCIGCGEPHWYCETPTPGVLGLRAPTPEEREQLLADDRIVRGMTAILAAHETGNEHTLAQLVLGLSFKGDSGQLGILVQANGTEINGTITWVTAADLSAQFEVGAALAARRSGVTAEVFSRTYFAAQARAMQMARENGLLA